jgi:chorismate synthase
MPITHELVTFQKSIGPGISVAIDGVPAKIRGDREKIRTFTFDTAYRIEHFLRVARERMANGETEIRFRFDEEV